MPSLQSSDLSLLLVISLSRLYRHLEGTWCLLPLNGTYKIAMKLNKVNRQIINPVILLLRRWEKIKHFSIFYSPLAPKKITSDT